MKNNVGDKFYKFNENDELVINRITRIQNDNCFVLTDEQGNSIKADNKALEGFTKIKPDGYITSAIVGLQDGFKDVIITLHKREDIENGDNTPYCAARQNILDIFTNQIKKEDTTYIGVSISKDTCPDDVDYNIVLACNKMIHMYMVSVYIDDTFEDIINLIPTKKFDEVLVGMNKTIANVQGYCTSLKQLLDENGFMYDFYRAFKITRVPFSMELPQGEEQERLQEQQRLYLQDVLKVEMFETYVLKYSKEIDLKKILRNYVLVSDINNKLYVVGYDKGEYVNSYYKQNITDKREMVALLKFRNNNKNYRGSANGTF
jgi:hypothetical protein